MKCRRPQNRRERAVRVLYTLVLASFLLPIAFLIVCLIFGDAIPGWTADRSDPDYILMIAECVLGVVVIHIPSLLSKRFRFELPWMLYILYIIFLYCAIFLGEVRSFYYVIPHWDVILHAFSSIMTGFFGMMVIHILNRDEHIVLRLSPFFMALFAFGFAMTVGALWEIYEYSFDSLLGLNMQKFRLPDGTPLTGHAALGDTMKDLIVDAAGAFVSSAIGYVSVRLEKPWFVPKLTDEPKPAPDAKSTETAGSAESADTADKAEPADPARNPASAKENRS